MKKIKTTTINTFRSSITLIKKNLKVSGQVHKANIAFIKEIHKMGREIHSQALLSLFAIVNIKNFHWDTHSEFVMSDQDQV